LKEGRQVRDSATAPVPGRFAKISLCPALLEQNFNRQEEMGRKIYCTSVEFEGGSVLCAIKASMFIIFGGLPGTGKTTISRLLAERLRAVYLRIDTIEQAICASNVLDAHADMGPTAYIVACHVAADNLRTGRIVVADSVNPIAMTRDAY
jgi:Cdc6-like AAA superfamily ATPase